jgi:hypothetical protein
MLTEGERRHPAIRGADEGEGALHPDRVEHIGDGTGLVGGGRGAAAKPVGDEVDAEDPEARRVGGAALAGHARPPVAGEAVGGDAAEHDDQRRPFRPGQARADALAEPGQSGRQRHLEWQGGAGHLLVDRTPDARQLHLHSSSREDDAAV